MAVVIRLARHGKKRSPFYRVVAADKSFSRDGRYLEVLGTYNPKEPNATGDLKQERLDFWISQGAKASDTVRQIINRSKKTS